MGVVALKLYAISRSCEKSDFKMAVYLKNIKHFDMIQFLPVRKYMFDIKNLQNII